MLFIVIMHLHVASYLFAWLQITVGHPTLADQNLLMSDEKSQVWLDAMSGLFFDHKSFYGNNE